MCFLYITHAERDIIVHTTTGITEYRQLKQRRQRQKNCHGQFLDLASLRSNHKVVALKGADNEDLVGRESPFGIHCEIAGGDGFEG